MRSSVRPTTAVFLDRDDTIIRDPGYLSDPNGIDILPGAAEAIRVLNELGIPAIIITNQSGIARGFFTEETLEAIHKRLTDLLAEQGARIDAIYYCPHHPDGTREEYRTACTCRKPQPGLLLRAAEDFGLDLMHCYLVGDKPIDLETIHKVGGKGILVSSEKDMALKTKTDFMAATIKDAVHWILKDMKR
jgi:D-glycero-D-manno-heptose 1,7-bisphosphate phosphatase